MAERKEPLRFSDFDLHDAIRKIDDYPADSMNKARRLIHIAYRWKRWYEHNQDSPSNESKKLEEISDTLRFAEHLLDDFDQHRYNPSPFLAEMALAYAELLHDFKKAYAYLEKSRKIIGNWGEMEYSRRDYLKIVNRKKKKIDALKKRAKNAS